MGLDVTFRRGARLRVLLVLIVLLAALPISALHLARVHASSEAAEQRAYQDAAALATSGVNAHARTLRRARLLLEMLAKVPAVRAATLPGCEEIIRSAQEGRDWVTGIFVIDAAGKGVCGASSIEGAVDVSDRDYFKAAKASKQYRAGDVIIGRISGRPLMAAVLPLLSPQGEFAGALAIGVSLRWIDRIAAEVNPELGGLVMAADGAGRLIAYQPAPAGGVTLQRLTENAQVQTILNSHHSTFEAKDAAGVDRLFSLARIPGSGITVAVGFDRSGVLRTIEQSFRSDLLFLLLVMAASIGLAWLVAEFGLLRGVRALKTAAQRLKAGKMGLRVRLPETAAAELHDLAATYNAMTAEFERLAYLDRLTGLPNRRYLERHMAKRDSRSNQPSASHNAVLAIDIDGFKPVNDNHGHAIGDRVLALIARRIAGAIDERGLLFRVGGDEFIAVIPLARAQGRDAARAIAEEIRQSMEQPIDCDELSVSIACSVGIALVPEDAANLAGAIALADAALYEAKRSGRNRVIESAPPLAGGLPGHDPRAIQLPSSRMELN